MTGCHHLIDSHLPDPSLLSIVHRLLHFHPLVLPFIFLNHYPHIKHYLRIFKKICRTSDTAHTRRGNTQIILSIVRSQCHLNVLSMKLDFESIIEIRPQIILNTTVNFTIISVGKSSCLRMNSQTIFSPLRS